MKKEKYKKRYRLNLTGKQIDAITTALFEWSEIEHGTESGRKICEYLDDIIYSINRQVRQQDNHEEVK
jgi:hypothetical protein